MGNPLKPGGFVQTVQPDCVWNFHENDFFGSTFLFLYYLNLEYLVIANKLKTLKNSKAEKTKKKMIASSELPYAYTTIAISPTA